MSPGVLDVALWRQKASLTLHLVNLTNPMMMKGPLREVVAVGEQKVRLRLPEGARALRVRLLVNEGSPEFRQAGPWLELTVPGIRIHEAVALDLSSQGGACAAPPHPPPLRGSESRSAPSLSFRRCAARG